MAVPPPSRRSNPDTRRSWPDEEVVDRLARLEAVVGTPPMPALQQPGGGLLGSVARLHDEIAEAGEKIDQLQETMARLAQDFRALTAEMRRASPLRGLSQRRAVVIAGLISALAGGVATVLASAKGPAPAAPPAARP